MKYFTNVTTLDELKKQYRRLAMKYHPDCGGSDEIMKQINAEHDALFETLKASHNKTADEYHQTTETAEEFREIIIALLKLDGLDGQLKDIRSTLCDQAVHNQRTEDSFVLARQDIAAVEERLNGKIRLEAERRCCADNSIVTYANATFYPKQVADVTVGTATTAQTLYNPIPKCGCDCGCGQ